MIKTFDNYLLDSAVKVKNSSGEAIPACSFAEITSYDNANHCLVLGKPSADILESSKVVIVPEAIANTKYGICFMDGLHAVKKTGGEAPSAGDYIGTDSGQFTAIVDSIGNFYVYYVSGDYLLTRSISGGGGGDAAEKRKAYCKTNAEGAATIVCYLDTDATGEEVTVTCSIAGGGHLDDAIPRLTDGLLIFVEKHGSTWYCSTVFQAIDIDELEIDTGKLSTKLFECP